MAQPKVMTGRGAMRAGILNLDLGSRRALAISALVLSPLLIVSGRALGEQAIPSGVLSLSASVTREVPNDTAVMTLFAERQGADPDKVADSIAQALDQGARLVKEDGAFRVGTGNVGTYPHHDRDGKVVGWRGRGELILESTEFQKLADAAARVNSILQVGAVRFKLSHAARARAETQLIEEAAAAFGEKASRAAKALGYSGYTIREVTLSSGAHDGPQPVPRFAKALNAQMEPAPLPMDGGRAELAVTVNGAVQMVR